MDPRALYVGHLDVINRIAESLCRRNGVRGADAEDFVADVRLKLLQDDYAVLRKYRGASSVTTFLTVVISNLFRDHRTKRWGKWRPSAEAKRRGALAVKLETAIYRDEQSFEQACTILSNDGGQEVDRAELRQLYDALPRRLPRHIEDSSSVADVPASEMADSDVLERERAERIEAAKAALGRAVERLDPEDRLVVRLHFYEGFSIADVARAVGLPQKPLYTRLRRVLEALSKDLDGQGIGGDFRDWLNSMPA